MTTATHPHRAQRKEPIMTTAPIIPFPGPRHAAPASEPLSPESELEATPRHGLYIAFERVSLGWWRWRCLHCGAAGTGHTDELALAAAIAHPCASEEVQA